MPEAFEIVRESPDELILLLDEHGLDGEAQELSDFVSSEIEAGRHGTFELDSRRAAVVTLEGVGVLIRLLVKARGAGGDLRVVSPHRSLDRKLAQTGLRSLLVDE